MAIPNFGHSGMISNSQAMREVATESLNMAKNPSSVLADYFSKNEKVLEKDALKELKRLEAQVGQDTYKQAYDAHLAGKPISPALVAAAEAAGMAAAKGHPSYAELLLAVKSTHVLSFQGAEWSGFIDTLSAGFNEGVQSLNKALSAATAGLQNDPTDPSKLAKVQSALSEYTIYRNSQSNMSKAFKDIASSAAQNLR
ncbi:type III secretion system needle filament subunit SctF [Iodobacter fluviatilis]|uniref:Type III secretion apparatus needle protein n=1 Tax=Iodobacter fluviatilis TaxID=537 RepID=A0A377Q610_9NEIS|nr:type III secretion system needle filament subunit SctF [Iodobacter fluviatilis]TCU80276.1 type III secretion apparatus needle protein [Iodobacter fluviatilis]STQ90185.1 type III secretion system needle complex protein PrgI [Iodobacter fluviatilis]